ncbi:glucose dehydrogenase [Drosophila madeirensis]|uniref:Glucose dehydrogenase n=1 Tax=Drosophila madeirensis TaxID=30013 RepID=A0AAU9G5K5_DROMD
MGQEISQQANQQQQQPHQQQQQTAQHKRQPQPLPQPPRKSFYSNNPESNQQPIYTASSQLSSNSNSNTNTNTDSNSNTNGNFNNSPNYRLRHKYNLSKQSYERTKILQPASQSDTDSNYAKLNSQYLQRSCSQSSDSGIYNSSCHCSSVSSLSALSSSGSSCSRSSSLVSSSKSHRSLDKQKHYLSHHLYIKSYLDILEEDERARAHFKSARPGGIRNYTPKILASGSETATSSNSSSICSAAVATSGRRSSVSGATSTGKHCQEDPWI